MKKMLIFLLLIRGFCSQAQPVQFYAGFEYKSIYLSDKPASISFEKIDRYLGIIKMDADRKMLLVPGTTAYDTVIATEVVKQSDRYIFKMKREKGTVQAWQQYMVQLDDKGEPISVRYAEGFKGNGGDSSFVTYGSDLRYVSFLRSSRYYKLPGKEDKHVWEDHKIYMHDGVVEWTTGKGKNAVTEMLNVKKAWVINETQTDGLEIECTSDDGSIYTIRYMYTEKKYFINQFGRSLYIDVRQKKDGKILWEGLLM